MGEPVDVSLGRSSNAARNQQAGAAQLENCYSEETPDGKNTWAIYATAGLTNFGSPLNDGPIRAMVVVGSTLYVVSGRDIFTVSSGGVATLIGGIPTSGPVYMAFNRRVPAQIGVVSDGVYALIDTGTNSVTIISDPDLPSPISIAFVNGYFVFPIDNARYMLSGLDDGSTIDGLDEGTAEFAPDDLVRSIALENELILLGTGSIEWHQDVGDADFPFARSHATEIGCLAPNSAAVAATPSRRVVLFVSPDHSVRLISGYSADKVSTNEIEDKIKKLHEAGNISQLVGFSFADSGRFFYVLRCDAWCYSLDLKEMQWHKRKSYEMDTWRVGSVVQFGTLLVAGDATTGQLYLMGDNYYMEGDQHLIPSITTPTVHGFPYPLIFNALYLDAAMGVGLNSPSSDIANPTVLVSWSDDGGYTFSAERVRSLGALGQTAKRVQPIYRLGKSTGKGRIFRIRISSPVERVILSISVDFEKLSP